MENSLFSHNISIMMFCLYSIEKETISEIRRCTFICQITLWHILRNTTKEWTSLSILKEESNMKSYMNQLLIT